jgi:arylamine N-acetyltransferase
VIDVTGYLRRLGVEHPGTPSVAGLTMLHRAQVERVAYTTVDIQRGRPPSIDPEECAARLVATGRGGYCFHLNGAFSALLGALGFAVRRHRGGVWHSPDQVPLEPYPNHLALTVHDLPTTANPGGAWLIDAGLGDALWEPMALRSGSVEQGGFQYRVSPSPILAGGWRFQHDPRGSFAGMDFAPDVAAPDAFAVAHADLSTSPTSGFVTSLVAQRRHAKGYEKLVSLSLMRTTVAGTTTQSLTGPDELRAVLADEFALPLDDFEPDEWELVYRRARAAQDEYERKRDD